VAIKNSEFIQQNFLKLGPIHMTSGYFGNLNRNEEIPGGRVKLSQISSSRKRPLEFVEKISQVLFLIFKP